MSVCEMKYSSVIFFKTHKTFPWLQQNKYMEHNINYGVDIPTFSFPGGREIYGVIMLHDCVL